MLTELRIGVYPSGDDTWLNFLDEIDARFWIARWFDYV
jgi:hypothetical protein